MWDSCPISCSRCRVQMQDLRNSFSAALFNIDLFRYVKSVVSAHHPRRCSGKATPPTHFKNVDQCYFSGEFEFFINSTIYYNKYISFTGFRNRCLKVKNRPSSVTLFVTCTNQAWEQWGNRNFKGVFPFQLVYWLTFTFIMSFVRIFTRGAPLDNQG